MVYVLAPGETYDPYVKLWQGFADRQGAVVVAPYDWSQDMLETAVTGAANKYGANQILITGFSNGGYNACAYGLAHPGHVASIVPMGAYCRTDDISGPADAKPPILVVAGAKDDWALGEEGDYITNANASLSRLGYRVNAIIVPGLGHDLPTAAMGEVEEWLKKVINN
jgi:predicted esterase